MPDIVTYNNSWLAYNNSVLGWEPQPDPYNPLGLPSHTIRCKFEYGHVPSSGDDITLVDADENVWDVYISLDDWGYLFSGQRILAVLGANTTGVTNMSSMFSGCGVLTTVPLFDTSSVTGMSEMFRGDMSLTSSIPLFDTSNVTNMSYMYEACYNVESGALALYNQASTQTNPPLYYTDCFAGCGFNTTTGRDELEQIPASWGGLLGA